jgi:tetratricopeptide (TPR) repeat protein
LLPVSNPNFLQMREREYKISFMYFYSMKLRRGIFIVVLAQIISHAAAYGNKIDSMLRVLSTYKLDTNKANTYHSICWAYTYEGDYITAVAYGDSALFVSRQINYQKGISWALNARGNAYKSKGDYIMALTDFNASLKIREQLKNNHDIAICLSNIGIVYKFTGNLPEAQRYYLRALKIYEAENDKAGQSIVLNNIGEIFRSENNTESALDYYVRSKKLKEEIKDERGLTSSYLNLGVIYFMQKKLDKALENFSHSAELSKKNHRNFNLAVAYMNIGAVYEEMFKDAGTNGKTPDAREFSKKALGYYNLSSEIYEAGGDKNGAADSKIKMGMHYKDAGDFGKARNYLDQALAISLKIQNKATLADCYLALSELADATNDFKNAHINYKKHIAIRDSSINDANMKKTLQQQLQYDFEKKEAVQKAEQVASDVKNEAEKRKQKIILWFTFGGLIVVFLLAAVILRSLIQNKRKNKIIMKQKLLVEQQKHEVEGKQKEILDSIRYAKRIQASLLTSEAYIERVFREMKKKMK